MDPKVPMAYTWRIGLADCPLSLNSCVVKYQAGLDPELYQALEDALWDEMSTMFGRRGAK
jgi:hypothetical protein